MNSSAQVWENYNVQASPEQKVYLVAAVSTATMGLLANLAGMFALGRHGLLRTTRHVLLFNQMVSGLLTSLAVVYPVQVVTSPLPAERFWQLDRPTPSLHDNYAVCYLARILVH